MFNRIALIALITLTSFAVLANEDLAIEETSRIHFIDGELFIMAGGSMDWAEALVDDILKCGDTVKTGEDSRATIKLANSSVIRLRPETQFTIPQAENKDSDVSIIELVKGFLWAKAKKAKDSLKVATPNSICGVRGTEFIVEVFDNDATEVSVLEGQVGVQNRDPKLMKTLVLLSEARGTMIRKGKTPFAPWKFKKSVVQNKLKVFEKFKTQNVRRVTREIISDLDKLEKEL